MQDAITKTYSAYGCMFKPGQVAPVGEAFREFQRMTGDEFFTLLLVLSLKIVPDGYSIGFYFHISLPLGEA